MIKPHLSLVRFLILAVSVASPYAVALAQNTTPTRTPMPGSLGAVPDTIRAARHALFNMFMYKQPILSDKLGSPPQITFFNRPAYPELPVEHSGTVIVGTIRGLAPVIFANGRGIYTEYHVLVRKILKDTANVAVSNQSIDMLELGGVVKMPNGTVVSHLAQGLGAQLEAERTYLLFLNFHQQADCFRIFKVWELRDGKAVATSRDDIERAQNGTSSFHGSGTDIILNAVSALVKAEGQE